MDINQNELEVTINKISEILEISLSDNIKIVEDCVSHILDIITNLHYGSEEEVFITLVGFGKAVLNNMLYAETYMLIGDESKYNAFTEKAETYSIKFFDSVSVYLLFLNKIRD